MQIENLKNVILNGTLKKNLLVDGPAGSGKTTLINSIKSKLGIKCLVAGVTGVASKLLDSRTISSFCRLGIYDLEPHEIIELNKDNESLTDIELLIVDEVSMWTTSQLEQVDLALRSAKNCFSKPFGGVRVCLFGDKAQLRPIKIIKEQNKESEVVVLDNVYDDSKKLVQNYNFFQVELTQLFRQQDNMTKSIILKLRKAILNQEWDESIARYIYRKLSMNPSFDGVSLFSNAKALPEDENLWVEEYYIPTNHTGVAPYDRLPIVEYGHYMITQTTRSNYSHRVNGEVVQIGDTYEALQYKTTVYDRVKVEREIVETCQISGKTTISKKTFTEDGDILYEYIPLMLLASATTRKVQGSTFESGSIGAEFFDPSNRVKKVSIEGWFRTLYVALGRFKKLNKVSLAA